MRYLRRFNENISIFNVEDWKKYLPDSVDIITNSGKWSLKKSDVNLVSDVLQVSYYHNTPNEYIDGGVNYDGEPDYLEFDIHIFKNNNGHDANSNVLKFNVNITYGDAMVSEFSIESPNNVKVIHYTGKGSLYDPDTFFGFSDDSLNELVNFFNRFGFKLSTDQFKFIDKENDEYQNKS